VYRNAIGFPHWPRVLLGRLFFHPWVLRVVWHSRPISLHRGHTQMHLVNPSEKSGWRCCSTWEFGHTLGHHPCATRDSPLQTRPEGTLFFSRHFRNQRWAPCLIRLCSAPVLPFATWQFSASGDAVVCRGCGCGALAPSDALRSADHHGVARSCKTCMGNTSWLLCIVLEMQANVNYSVSQPLKVRPRCPCRVYLDQGVLLITGARISCPTAKSLCCCQVECATSM
jgi:hypothetical protein